MDITIYQSSKELAERFCKRFERMVHDHFMQKNELHIALSGGSTPLVFYKELICQINSGQIRIDWENIHLYWSDERCVPPDTIESNYYNAKLNLLNDISIPESNIHRLKGECNPKDEAEEYSKLLLEKIPIVNDLPQFDLVLLGMGTDGHIASIFPDQLDLFNTPEICAVATHPISKQKRITLSGKVINNACNCVILVTGADKSRILAEVFKNWQSSDIYPATHVDLEQGRLAWVVDKDAYTLLF